MTCVTPLTAYQDYDGNITFHMKHGFDERRQLNLPCGRCVGCLLERSRQWAVRIMNEVSMHAKSCFITLTYNEYHLPHTEKGFPTLKHEHFQLFMKRLRKRFTGTQIKYFMCGEYGSKGRPHYHAILFGIDFNDRAFAGHSPSGFSYDSSKLLSDIWTHGFVSVGAVTFESAAYVARYILKKINSRNFEYMVKPEYIKMSLREAIGKKWLMAYQDEVINNDFILSRGFQSKPPRYYDKLLSKLQPTKWAEVKEKREFDGYTRREDNTPDRLLVKKEIIEQKLNKFKRNIE